MTRSWAKLKINLLKCKSCFIINPFIKCVEKIQKTDKLPFISQTRVTQIHPTPTHCLANRILESMNRIGWNAEKTIFLRLNLPLAVGAKIQVVTTWKKRGQSNPTSRQPYHVAST